MIHQSYRLAELAPHIQAKIIGDENTVINKMASLANAQSTQLSFVNGTKYIESALQTKAGALIVSEDVLQNLQSQNLNIPYLVVANPYLAFAILTHIFEVKHLKRGIEHTAQIDDSAIIGDNVYIGHHVVIGHHAVIGDNTIILANTVIGDKVEIGANSFIESNVSIIGESKLGQSVRIHANTVIGGEGFGFAPYQGQWHRIAQLGSVRIGNGVRIGSNCSIDRGALDDTIIADGVIIDNLVQIAHNVQIGEHTAIAAKCGIAGSTKIGKNCILGGDCGLVGHISIADNVTLTAQSMVTKSITEAGSYSSGTSFFETNHWKKTIVRLRQLADLPLTQMAKKIDDMQAKIETLQAKLPK